jgi:2-iminobutanoate/2-iminopropanoate deaminase
MKREVVATKNAPAAVGPYSQAIVCGDFVFTAGHVGNDPATGKLVEGGIQAQTQQAFKNLSAVLEAAGTSLEHVVKATVFLKDMNDFAAMNEVYAGYFGDAPPARSTVQVTPPIGALVEIEMVAIRP